MDNFQEWLRTLLMERGVDLFRSKGILHFKGHEAPYVFHAVHMLMSGSFDEDHETKKKAAEKNRLIFIGRNLDREELNRGFQKCVA